MGDAEGLGVLLGGYGSDADSDQARKTFIQCNWHAIIKHIKH